MLAPLVMGIFCRSCRLVISVLRRLRRDVVADAGGGVEPERRRGLKTAAQRDQQVLRHVALREADLLGLGAVHVEMQLGIIEGLLNPQIDRAGNEFQLVQQLFGEIAVGIQIAADDLNVDGSGQAEIQDLGDDVDRQFVET